jgi:hypothetical protein
MGGGYKYVSECGVGVYLSDSRISDKLRWGGEVYPTRRLRGKWRRSKDLSITTVMSFSSGR